MLRRQARQCSDGRNRFNPSAYTAQGGTGASVGGAHGGAYANDLHPAAGRDPQAGVLDIQRQGTSRNEFVLVPPDWSDEEIKSELEEWCQKFGCWHMSESYMRYGWNDEKDFGSRK